MFKNISAGWVFLILLLSLLIPSIPHPQPRTLEEGEVGHAYIHDPTDWTYEDQFAQDVWECEVKARAKNPRGMLEWDVQTRECLRKEKGYLT